MISRREFLKLGAIAGGALMLPRGMRRAFAEAQLSDRATLSDPALQPKFVELAPNALDPGFKFIPDSQGQYNVAIRETSNHSTGLIDPTNGRRLKTRVWGYGDERGPTWPGRTFEVKSTSADGSLETRVRWLNELQGKKHLLPVDTNLHWCYSLPGYQQYSIEKDGVPIITHLHGGHSDSQFDGNPEFFYSPLNKVKGPQWYSPDGADHFTNVFKYDNDVPAGNLWYHDHALGITRLNVYAGLAGFYFVRDEFDTGLMDNPLGLPAFPYELAYAIQDRMFTDNGELFYPAFPGDPAYDDFIIGEGVDVCPPDEEGAPCLDPNEPTALAEFFGDHMVVNGKIWPKENVEPRNYRMRLLNGCDSRFMVIQFVAVDPGVDNPNDESASAPLDFWVIGSDQGLGTPAQTDKLLVEPGGRYDIVVDFSQVPFKSRVIMKNIGGDEPFGGDIPGPQIFGETDRIMAFDVVLPLDTSVPDDFDSGNLPGYGGVANGATTRRVALFEGKDEFGRLQPLLGTVANNLSSATAYTWFQATTENPDPMSTEEWEIYNFTGDAHPIHLHLVNFEILGRRAITFDADEDNPQQVEQHNGKYGTVATISNIKVRGVVHLRPGDGYFEKAPKDMVTALPGQVTKIKATFDKSGRYVWHCHILSHEDHEMMRVLHVGPMP